MSTADAECDVLCGARHARITSIVVACHTYCNLSLRRVLEPLVDHGQSVTHFDCGKRAFSYMTPTVEQEALQPLQCAR